MISPIKNNLKFFIKKDPRIKRVYDYAKRKYLKSNRAQHNWEHIIRVLYRALVIAKTIKGVNYSILIPAILLHDIGVTETNNYSEHAQKGAEISRRDLVKMKYKIREIDEISQCVESHGGKRGAKPISLEAKIVFDTDRLEKSGLAGVFASYRAQYELGKSIKEWARPRRYKNREFFTEKAKEISGNGFKEIDRHFLLVQKSLKGRKDWGITERDLWKD